MTPGALLRAGAWAETSRGPPKLRVLCCSFRAAVPPCKAAGEEGVRQEKQLPGAGRRGGSPVALALPPLGDGESSSCLSSFCCHVLCSLFSHPPKELSVCQTIPSRIGGCRQGWQDGVTGHVLDHLEPSEWSSKQPGSV